MQSENDQIKHQVNKTGAPPEEIAAALGFDPNAEHHTHQVETLDIWESSGMPMQPEAANWALNIAGGELPDGTPDIYGILVVVTPNSAVKVWLKDEGFDNLIRFLQEAKRERGKKEMEAFAQMKKKVEVVKPQLIIPGQSGPGGRFIPNPNPQS